MNFYRICINGCPCAVKAFKMPRWAHPPGNLGIPWQTQRMAKTSSYWLPRRMLLAGSEALHPGTRGKSCTAGSKQSQSGCSHNTQQNNWTGKRIAHQHLQPRTEDWGLNSKEHRHQSHTAQRMQSPPLWPDTRVTHFQEQESLIKLCAHIYQTYKWLSHFI